VLREAVIFKQGLLQVVMSTEMAKMVRLLWRFAPRDDGQEGCLAVTEREAARDDKEGRTAKVIFACSRRSRLCQ
jgi:hypothetical protein